MKLVEHQIPRGPNGEKDLNDWDQLSGWTAMKDQAAEPANDSQFTWAEEFMLDDAQVEAFEDPEWIYENLIISGHILALAADPGAGKTTVCTSLCGDLARRGYEVFYVLADIGQTDVKHYHRMARQDEWKLLLPDLVPGHSMDSVVGHLAEMNQRQGDWSGVVFFFDTLKKMVNVIQKGDARKLMGLLRGLTAKGMTVVLLGHTNKYKDADGDPVFEGTHDIKTDSDDMIYLIPMKQDDGTLLVSTKPSGKVRGAFEPITFRVNQDRTVERMPTHVDTAREIKNKQKLEDDEDYIEMVRDAIAAGQCKQAEIVAFAKERHMAEKRTIRVLRDYSRSPFSLWTRTRGMEKKTWIHTLPN